jgi:hypothetical protein
LRKVIFIIAGLLLASLAIASAPAAQAATVCDDTIFGPGPIDGPVFVPEGEDCNLQGIEVQGSVYVARDATLVIGGGSNIDGNVTAQRAGTFLGDPLATGEDRYSVVICNTLVQGYVFIERSMGRVLVGGDGCGGNRIEGNVNLSRNLDGVELVGNDDQQTVGNCPIESSGVPGGSNSEECKILGSVTIEYNTGRVPSPPYPSNRSAVVGYNEIDGNLKCNYNSPGVTNNGGPNDVGGFKSGQCANL